MSSRVSAKKSSRKKLTLRERRLIRESAGPIAPLTINKVSDPPFISCPSDFQPECLTAPFFQQEGDTLNADTQPDPIQTPMPKAIKRRQAVHNLKEHATSLRGRKLTPDAEEDAEDPDSSNSTEKESTTPTQSSMVGSSPEAKEGSARMTKDVDETTNWQARVVAITGF